MRCWGKEGTLFRKPLTEKMAGSVSVSVQSLSCAWLFDKTWSTGDGNGKPLQYSCLENCMNSIKRQKYRTLKDELSRSVGAQYAIGDQWRNNFRKNEGILCPWGFPSKNTGVGCYFLQGIFLTEGSNPNLLSPAVQLNSLLLESSRNQWRWWVNTVRKFPAS